MTEPQEAYPVELQVRLGQPQWVSGSGYQRVTCTFDSHVPGFMLFVSLAERVRGDEEPEFREAVAEVLNSDAGIEDWHEEDREVWSINEVNDSFLPDKMVARVAAALFEGELGARLLALYS